MNADLRRSLHALGRLTAAGLLVATTAGAGPPPRASAAPESVSAILGPLATREPTRVLVLGTVHLSGRPDMATPGATARARAVLAAFRPTLICVEALRGEDVAAMAARGGTAAQVAEMFAAPALRHGRTMQAALRIDRDGAAARAEALLAQAPPDPGTRTRLVALLLAAFELPSAVLQWSYLTPEQRAQAGLPAEVATFLEAERGAANETYSLALPLASGAGLERLVGIDSQWDGARLLAMPEAAVEELFAHRPAPAPAAEAGAGPGGDLLDLLLAVNTPDYARRDVRSQWGWLLETNLASGLARYRIGQWQSRNLRMAANIGDAIHSPRAERVIVLVGAAHKPFLESDLGPLVEVELVQLSDIAPATAAAAGSGRPEAALDDR